MVHLYQHFKEWRKNPRWSISCCLEVLLPLSDMPGEVSALAETNVLDKQLQSGQLEMPKVVALVREIDHDGPTHEESDHASNNTLGVQNGCYNCVACSTKTCHQGTQTNLFANNVVHHLKLEI